MNKLLGSWLIALTALIVVVAGRASLAQQEPVLPTSRPTTRGAEEPTARRPRATTQDRGEEPPVVTEHELALSAGSLKYKAAAGFIPLKDQTGKLRAKVFYIAYEKTGDGPAPATRPVTFVFNGGPGAASVWLHLGTAGPQRIDIPETGSLPAPPYRLVDNNSTWLDFTDLVFIDPVGTGFSRAEGDRAQQEFYNVNGDISSVADVIRLYLTMQNRWASPKFVAGESYGTTRAAGLSQYLHDRYGIDANGIVLISTVLNFQTLQFGAGNDTPYPLWLPSYTAAAWYHKKLAPELQQMEVTRVIAEAQQWAMDQYMPALMRGTSLDEPARQRIAQQLARYTGLPLDYVNRSHLKIPPSRFEKALLGNQEKVIGRMDARLTGHDVDPLNDTPSFDPSMTGYFGIFSSSFNDYVERQLKFESDLPYEFLSETVGPWDFGRGEGYLDISTRLRTAMTAVPSMKVMIASGYYDLATPLTATDYTVNQMALSPELKKNIVQKYYEGGHMLYLNRPSLVRLHDDMRDFYRFALPATQPSR